MNGDDRRRSDRQRDDRRRNRRRSGDRQRGDRRPGDRDDAAGRRALDRRTVLGAVAGVAGALAGCGYLPGGGDPRWSSDVLGGLSGPSTYVRAGDALAGVYASVRDYDFDAEEWSSGGRVVAVSLADGTERWSYRGSRSFTRGATAGGGTLFVGHDGPGVLAASDGERRWTRSTSADVAALAHADETVYAATREGDLAAFDAASGDRRWERTLEGAPRFDGSLAADGDGAYLDGEEAGLRAVAPDGTDRWTRRGRYGATAAGRPFTVADGTVYVAGDGGLLAVATADGTDRWHGEGGDGLAGRPRVDGDRVYHVTASRLACLSVAEGELLWSADPGGPYGARFSSGVAPATDTVAVGEGDHLTGFDRATGDRRWRVAEHAGVVRTAATDDGPVAVLSDGTLSARHG